MNFEEFDSERVQNEATCGQLQRKLNDLRLDIEHAHEAGDTERVQELRKQGAGIVGKLAEIRANEDFRRACPVRWVVSAEDEAIERAIEHEKLKIFAARENVAEESVLLMGPTGVGKSTAAALALRRQIRARIRTKKPVEVSWYYARALAHSARYYPLGEGEPPDIEKARTRRLLVLDDLGLERDHGEIVDVLHARYEQGFPTWTTTGLNYEQLNDRYGEALVRRLTDGLGDDGISVNAFPKESMQ
jgi:DNA replication protein DnaC